jgi:hypothetical protein
MGKLSFAVDEPVAVSYRQNVLPFDAARHRAGVRLSRAARPRPSEGVVVRLPKAPCTDETISKSRAKPPPNGETRFTVLDFVATAFLILSVFSAPALVWSLVRTASLG